MNELRVPTVALPAEILFADGRTLMGRIFVPAAASHHEGAMRPEEWINDPHWFFPFLPDDASGPVILNKEQLVVVSVAFEPAEDHGELERAVRIECAGRILEGNLHIEMPTNQQRVLDYLNQPPAFAPLYAGERLHLVHKRHVTRLSEPRS
jgi:hypothetical protein